MYSDCRILNYILLRATFWTNTKQKMFSQRIWLGCLRQLASRSKARLAHTAREEPQYDISEKMRKLFERKQKQRETTKAYLRKIVMNPYRPKVDTVPFDPVLFRYNALMTYHDYYIQLNANNVTLLIICYIIPIGLATWFFTYIRGNLEKQYRAGKIAPKDRHRFHL